MGFTSLKNKINQIDNVEINEEKSHAAISLSELKIPFSIISQENMMIDCFKDQIPEIYLKDLKIYLKHDSNEKDGIVLSGVYGPKGQPVVLVDFLKNSLYDDIDNIQDRKNVFNADQDASMILSRTSYKILDERINFLRKKESQERNLRFQEESAEREKERLLRLHERREIQSKRSEAEEYLTNLNNSDIKKMTSFEKDLIKASLAQYQEDVQLSENQMENTIISNKNLFGLNDWFLMYRQFSLSAHGKPDLIYRNEKGELNIIELEIGPMTKDHFSKSRIYRRQLSKDLGVDINKIRITLIANEVHATIQEECDDLGMTVVVMDRPSVMALIEKLPKSQ